MKICTVFSVPTYSFDLNEYMGGWGVNQILFHSIILLEVGRLKLQQDTKRKPPHKTTHRI